MALIISVDHGFVAGMQISVVHRLILGFKGFQILHQTNLSAMSTDDTLDPNLEVEHGGVAEVVFFNKLLFLHQFVFGCFF